MDTIENIATIKTKDINRLEMARKKLKISQTFISQCLGKSDSAWNQWLHSKKEIPNAHLDQVINILETAENLLQGRRCLPIKNGYEPHAARIDKDVLESVIDFLEIIEDPQISIFADKHKEVLSLIKTHSQMSTELLKQLKSSCKQ